MNTLAIRVSYPLFRAIEARKITPDEFNAKVLRLSAKIDRIGRETAVEIKAELRNSDRAIRDGITGVADSGELARGAIFGIINREIDAFNARRDRIMRASAQRAIDSAQEFRQKVAAVAGERAPQAPINPKIAEDIFEIQREAGNAFAEDLKARLFREVTDGLVKGKTPIQIAQEIVAKRVVTPQRKANDPAAHGALAQIEKLIRTELRQIFNAAMFSGGRAEQAQKAGILKAWITKGDAQVRVSHSVAGRRYGVGGSPGPIPLRRRFKIGQAKLQFPCDPSGPPEETINCRCVSVQIIPEVEERVENGED